MFNMSTGQISYAHFLFSSCKILSCIWSNLYMDLWTPPIVAIIGVKYFLLIVDDYKRFIWIYFLNVKSQVESVFQLFMNIVERQFSVSIKDVQTDGGEKFQLLTNKWQSHGLFHWVTGPHTSEQNGIMKCRHQRVVKKGLSFLLYASIRCGCMLLRHMYSPLIDCFLKFCTN